MSSFKGLNYKYAGENLAEGFDNDLQAFVALMNSKSHRDNILNTKYKQVGIGYGSCNLQVVLFTN
jgi:uncharacterized protein YkwD